MANGTDQDIDKPPDFRSQGEQLAIGATSAPVLERQGKFTMSLLAEGLTLAVEYLIGAASWVAIKFAGIIMRAEDRNAAEFRELTRTAIRDLTGADPSGGHRAIGRTLLNSLTGGAGAAPGGAIAPSTDGAEAYMEIVMQLALEGYVEGGITSALSAGFLDKFTELDDILAQVLGLGRMSRRVMGPLMDARVITPFRWHVYKQYRPELLAAGAAIEAHLAGRLDLELLLEELARQGYTNDRIFAMVENAKKRLGFGDLVELWFRGGVSKPDVIRRARDLGYDEATANELLGLAEAKRREKWWDAAVDQAIASYLSRDIDEGTLRQVVEANAPSYSDAQLIISTTKLRLGLRPKSLSAGEARRLAKLKILSVVDYRRALERGGYEPEAVIALELELRVELQEQADVAAARRQLEQERAAEKAERERERQAREAELADRRALPALADIRRAYVRGLVGRDRLEAAIVRDKINIDAADLLVLLADADADRAQQLAALERRAAADAKAADQVLPLATLETSVLRDILTIDRYEAELRSRGFDDGERAILVGLLRDRLAQRDEARAEQQRAAQRAELAGVNLPAFERAVRLGLRSPAEYGAFLERIGTPDFARALMADLLAAQLAEDAAARQVREQRDAAAAAKAINLPLRRRAVVAGVLDRAAYETALRAAAWPA
ncbi:MAG: hypothetical protein WBC33_06645, partial [Conexibacter sp.]